MKKVFRAALVGCGAICGNHINAIIEAGGELVALCDINADAARAAAEKFSLNANIYTDYTEMLDIEKPDSVHICTPHYLHAKMSIAALERGINVLCEKPLCINRTELERIAEAVKNSTAQMGICHQNRYEPNMLALRAAVGDKAPVGALGVVSWNRDADYYASGEWRGKWLTEGGGVMINQALHTLDLLQWIAGMPVSVTAHIANDHLKNEIEVEDTATALFETEDGRALNFFATTACGSSFPAQLHIKTADGKKLYADNKLLIENGEVKTLHTGGESGGKSEWGRGHALLIADFYRCLESGEHFTIDAAEASKVIRLILSMYESNGKKTSIY